MNTYLWLGIFVASLVIEGMTSMLIAVWFAPSALICMLLAYLNVHAGVQIGIFFGLSAVLMLLFYKKLRDNIHNKSEKTNTDALMGKIAVVEDDIKQGAVGRVKVGGISWSAYCPGYKDTVYAGEYVKILSIDGVKLCCEKTASETHESVIFETKA